MSKEKGCQVSNQIFVKKLKPVQDSKPSPSLSLLQQVLLYMFGMYFKRNESVN
jgi:hypothetical protein